MNLCRIHWPLQLVVRQRDVRVQHRLVRHAACDTNGKVRRDGVHPTGFLLVVYLSMFYAVLPAAAQSDSNENKSKDEGKREEVKEIKKDDVRKDTPGTPFKPGGLIHFDVDLAVMPIKDLQIDVAGRFEHYTDFGDAHVGKITARYDITPEFAVRGTVAIPSSGP